MSGTYYYQDFPALMQTRTAATRLDRRFAYLDNAATTQKPSAVLRAVEGFYEECNANPYRGAYRMSVNATKLYECSRAIVAEFIGADTQEVIFTRNTTESLNLIAYAYAMETLQKGDEIALPVSEHHSNLVVWQQVCKRTGAALVYLTPDKNGRLREEEILQKVGPKTKILALAHISNVLGTINPIAKITRHAHDQGAIVVLDCAQSVAHLPLDVHALDVDFAAFSGHKMYGPLGIGVLYGKQELLENMSPFMFGGEMIDAVREHKATFEEGPKRFEAGTPNVAGAVGLATAIDYIETIGFDKIAEIEHELTDRLLTGLREEEAARIYGNPDLDDDRGSVVAFNIGGVNPQDLALILDDRGIAIRSGSHCAQPLHRRLGIEASCRVSPCFYNTPEEIDHFLESLHEIRRTVGKRIMAVFP